MIRNSDMQNIQSKFCMPGTAPLPTYLSMPMNYFGQMQNGCGPPHPLMMTSPQHQTQQVQNQYGGRINSANYDAVLQIQQLVDQTTNLRKQIEITNENVLSLMVWKQQVAKNLSKKRKRVQIQNGPPSNLIAGASEAAISSLKDTIVQWAELNNISSNTMEDVASPAVKRMQGI